MRALRDFFRPRCVVCGSRRVAGKTPEGGYVCPMHMDELASQRPGSFRDRVKGKGG